MPHIRYNYTIPPASEAVLEPSLRLNKPLTEADLGFEPEVRGGGVKDKHIIQSSLVLLLTLPMLGHFLHMKWLAPLGCLPSLAVLTNTMY